MLISSHQLSLVDSVALDCALHFLTARPRRQIPVVVEGVNAEELAVCSAGRLRTAIAHIAESVTALLRAIR